MNNYSSYAAHDLAADPSFADWVRQPTDPRHAFWSAWVAQNPDRQETIVQAIILVQAVPGLYDTDQLTTYYLHENVARIVAAAQSTDRQVESPIRRSLGWWGWSSAVAAAVLLLITGFWYYQSTVPANTSPETAILAASTLIERVNTGERPMTVLLSDGSVVTLEPNSRLSFPRTFATDMRQVNLAGEAFFDVKKNPNKPFLVRTDRSVTRVLGTSFRVRAFGQKPISVLVRTGRVAVYALDKAGERSAASGASSVLLPNQRAEITDGVLTKTNVLNRSAVAPIQIGPSEITFDDQPVTDVLTTLARLYEVKITFDAAQLGDCRITTSFAEETLPERLSSICGAIGATYRIEADQIAVEGRGCSSAANSLN
jgi:ferric-dicitrate binding protein FerR (iron transport regulator)